MARHVESLGSAVPEHAEAVLAEEGWSALAATLQAVEDAGADPVAALRDAAGRTVPAGMVADVLLWRLRRRQADVTPTTRRASDSRGDAEVEPEPAPSMRESPGRARPPGRR